MHDALLIQARAEDIAHQAWLAKEAMRQASADILLGFELFIDGWGETDASDFIIYPNRYRDPRGHSTWARLAPLLLQHTAGQLVR